VSLASLALSCGLAAHLDLLSAIVRMESGGNPLALAVNGALELVRQPAERGEAVALARWLLAGGHNFDAGLAQVNSANFARLGLDAASVFEPCANLRAAATILDECSERARALGLAGRRAEAAALSCYNTGHLTRGIANGYVDAVRARPAPHSSGSGPSNLRRRPAAIVPLGALATPGEAFRTAVADAFASDAAAGLGDCIAQPPVRSPPNTERRSR